MRVKTAASCLLTCIVVAAALFTSACKSSTRAERASDAALVPGADFVARIDVKAIRAAPIIQQLEATQNRAGHTDSKDKYTKFQEATGLTHEDILAVMISADADSVDLANGPAPEHMSHMKGAAAIELAKPLDTDTLIAGLRVLLDDGASATISKLQLDGSEAVVVASTKPGAPKAYAATLRNANTVYLAFNRDSLQAALQREKTGKTLQLPSGLHAVSDAASQASIVLVAPKGLRTMIREQLAQAQENPQAAMIAGFITPFQGLQSVSISAHFSTGMQFDIAGDLGEAQAATQVDTLIQTMAMPMLKGLMAQSSGAMPSKLEDQFKTSVEGSVLRIRLSVTGEEVLTFQKAKTGAKTAAASEPY